MDVSVIVQLVSSLGFPILACIWMATKFDKTLKANTDAIAQNRMVLEAMHARLDKIDDELEAEVAKK